MRCAGMPAMACPAKPDAAGIRTQHARNQIERRGLAGAVGTEQADDLAGLHREVDGIDRDQPAEGAGQRPILRAQARRPAAVMPGTCGAAGASRLRLSRSHNPTTPVRQRIDDQQEHDADDQGRGGGKARRQKLEQQRQRDRAERRSPQPVRAAEQRHDHDLKRNRRVERDRRLDIGPARRHDRADQGHEHGADREQRHFCECDIDPAMFCDGLVLADDAQCKTEARAGDQPADREHRDRERQQLPVDVALGDVDEHVAAEHAGLVDLEPDHQLADEFGEAEGEDDKMQAAEPQRRNADDRPPSARRSRPRSAAPAAMPGLRRAPPRYRRRRRRTRWSPATRSVSARRTIPMRWPAR